MSEHIQVAHDVQPRLDEKTFATLAAKYALAGYAAHKLADGGYMISRWSMSRYFPDMAALASFLAIVGGKQ
ncbi:hypothetical protein [Diaphorobacter caeni]|uniref:hypothetical protein n=1 Tax=Diaphorobacter caeni TaxID=2784387 RepID=UPI00188EB128|nr:hypothetical protein [Diaphorobacter caeni]MBF5004772.1 hypothetical protein [Diaphorobacter caeni]